MCREHVRREPDRGSQPMLKERLMRVFMILLIGLGIMLASCSGQKAPAAETTRFDKIVMHLGECKKEPACKAKFTASSSLLQGCPWYESAYCSAATAAAAAACVVTEGEACLPAIELVKSMGCCDCLPAGVTRDMCKDIP